MKIKNGLDTVGGCPQLDNGQEDLKSPNRPPAAGGNTVKDGENVDDGEAEGVDGEENKGEDGFHMKGGGDSQPYNGHRWGLGCCHYVRQVPEEDTFRLKCSQY